VSDKAILQHVRTVAAPFLTKPSIHFSGIPTIRPSAEKRGPEAAID
jgi:hypothetical protein